MFNKLKQFKDLRSQAKELESKLSQESATGSASFGKVQITMNGNQKITEVAINPELLTADNKAKIEGAIKDALNDAQDKIKKVIMVKMQKGEISMPNMG
jgi:DNA-binding YbaB/EbfC family protein